MTVDSSAQTRFEQLSPQKAELFELLRKQRSRTAGSVDSISSRASSKSFRCCISGAQRRLWFIDQLEGGSQAYHLPLALRLRGNLDRIALQAALDAILARHEALRSVFMTADGQPMQEIRPIATFALAFADLRSCVASTRDSELDRHLQEEFGAPFDLRTGPLVRGRLIQVADAEHVFAITTHHIVSDGWSIGVFIRELSALYAAHLEGRVDPLAPLALQYADYARWQQQWEARARWQEQLRYWKEHLQGAPELLELPSDRPRPAAQTYRGESVPLVLDPELVAALKRFSRRRNVTLAMTLQTAWTVLLSRLSSRDDIVLGIPAANRTRSEFESLIGFFVNTLAVRVKLDDDPTVFVLMQRLREVMLAAYAHQDVPFDKVVEAVQPVRSLRHSPIFQAMFSFQSADIDEVKLPGLELTQEPVLLRTSHFDLTLSLRESGGAIHGLLNYASDLFDRGTVEAWGRCLDTLLRGMLREPERQVSRLQLMGEEERDVIVRRFGAPPATFSVDAQIQQLFEQQVERSPDALAVVHGESSLTYAQLNARANQLAWYLREKGVGPDRLVAICVERSLDMVVGMLGILKAGGAYVPLDPAHASDRLAQMLDDCDPAVVLTQSAVLERLNVLQRCERVVLDELPWVQSAWARCTTRNPKLREIGLSPAHLAYVIYTSGSTGKPKGVMVEHRNVLHFLHGMEQCIHGLPPECRRIAWNSSFGFDMAAKAWGQLIRGRAVYLLDESTRMSGEDLLAFLERYEIEAIECTPSHLRIMRHAGFLHGRASSLRKVLLGGEAIDEITWKELAAAQDVAFFNMYGPTECSVDASCGRIEGDAPHLGCVMPNARVYILDAHLQAVPVGVVGEICIGGGGVARGYLRRAELTAERFVPDPFSADPQARMYRTGDLGRWRADGTIEYCGRNDHQVKIRGFRIELGEIEAQLRMHAHVKDAVVIAREDVPGEKRLVAYVTAREVNESPTAEELRSHLKARLPEYMLPSAFVVLEHLPLTSNGKLDRRALPAPERDACVIRRYEAPQGELEEILAGVWQALLRVERVGRHDNFFELGGHSLLIMHMIERLRRVGLAIELRRIFDSPTLADLARELAPDTLERLEIPPNGIPAGCTAIRPEMLALVELEQRHIDLIVGTVPGGASNIQDVYPLAPLQEGILFHHLLSESTDVYVVSTLLHISSRERLDALIDALQAVIDHHDVLRTSILWEQLPQPVQVVHRQAPLRVIESTLDASLSIEGQLNDWIRPERQRLDLRRAPIIRLQAAAAPNASEWYALLQMHHIIADATSGRAMVADIVAKLEKKRPLQPSLPYRRHVAQSLAYASANDAAAFFRSKLSDVEEPTAPFGHIDVHGDGTRIAEACEQLEPELARRLRAQARRLGVSAATLLHAAWAVVAARTSGRGDVVFGTVLLGRLHGIAGSQRALGMFINTLPLRVVLSCVSVEALVEQTQRELVELLSHEQASLALAQRCSSIAGSSPLFTTLFNYRHGTGAELAGWQDTRGIRQLRRHNGTNYPITVSVDDSGETFAITAQTDERLEPSRVLRYLRAAIGSLTSALEKAPDTPSLSLAVLPEDERSHLLATFNSTEAPVPARKLIHELFEEQVKRTPSVIAVVHGQQTLTYRELNRRSNQLAHYLIAKDVGPNRLVGICMERGPEMIVGLLGILKAGGAYMPLDPSYPMERLAYMLQDGAPQVVLLQSSLRNVLPPTNARIVELDTDRDELDAQPTHEPRVRLPFDSQSLLYVIYTSGSTGRPKGTAMPHRSMVNLIEWHRAVFGDRYRSRVLQFAALGFDVAFQEIFSTLCIGGALVLLDECVRRDAIALLELMSRQYVERLFVPPLMLQSLAEAYQTTRIPLVLKDVITAGEQLRISPEIVALFSRLDECRLHNHYGPTETHVVTASTLTGDPRAWPLLPSIGQPIANAKIYVLDAQRELAPIGVAGEIYVGGAVLASGYLNRPELTAERFILDPFSNAPDARMYKTGDLGRWREDGTIEFLGRNDDQVKIRGFRIELGEIEAQLALHEHVREAAVVAREDPAGQKRLVAYVTASGEHRPNADALRLHLKSRLPEHMVPSAYVVLDALPLTPTGKLNRRDLPAPESRDCAIQPYDPPRGEVELTLASIWQDLLGVERVGRDDSFFEIGGHSLLVLKALFKINQARGCSLRVTDVYKSPTIRELAARVQGKALEEEFVDLAREAAIDIDIVPRRTVRAPARAILLTGATGFVGRFLLAQLLEDTNAKIYCIVRAQSDEEALFRLRMTLLRWDLWSDELQTRVVAVRGDLRQSRLGLDAAFSRTLARDVDCIYHCATSMNHLETYSMARLANVAAAKDLLRLAVEGRPKVVNYVSTLGVFSAATSEEYRTVHEHSSIDHEKHSNSRGYVASKWVGEKIFMTANERGVPCNIFRVGLVWADTKLGRYDELQRGYRLLKSCLLSGYGIRDYRLDMAPTPVDYVTRAVVCLANRHPAGGGVFHIASGAGMHEGMFERCNEAAGTSLELIPYYDWICEMKRLHREGRHMPVVPLIEFAFSMDEAAFKEYLRSTRSKIHFDFAYTHEQLEREGIIVPAFGGDLLRRSVEAMLARDGDLTDRIVAKAVSSAGRSTWVGSRASK